MGNRAVITTSTEHYKGTGIYLHWNGGIESILAFCAAAKERGYRDPAADSSYAMARLTGLLHEFFDPRSCSSIGIGSLEHLDCDNFDNGVYVIGRNWEIVDRYGKGSEPINQEINSQIIKTEKCSQIIEILKLKNSEVE